MALKIARSLFALQRNSRGHLYNRSCFVHRDTTSSSSAPSFLLKDGGHNNESLLYLGRPDRKNSLIKSFESHRAKVALVDNNEEFLYEDILRRSLDLATVIRDLFKYENESTDHKICYLCSNGMSFILATLACWLSGNTAVPLSIYHEEKVMDHVLSQNSSPFVITTKEFYEKISPVSKANKRQIVVLDSSWTGSAVKSFNTDNPLPLLFDESFYHGDRSGLILYTTGISSGIPKPVTLNHYAIDSRLKKTVDAWELKSEDITLHAIPFHKHYGIIDSLLAPMSVGGKVVSLNSSDPTKIWSHLLGIGINSSKPIPKASCFPATPNIYCRLLKSHNDLFHNQKIREYVKSSCTKKIRLMACGNGSLSSSVKNKWKGITGHTIVDTYTTVEVGTVLCGNICKPELDTRDSKCFIQDFCKPLPGNEVRVVRFMDNSRTKYEVLSDNSDDDNQGVVGELLLRNQDNYNEDVDHEGWFSTGDIVRLKGDQIQFVGKIIQSPMKRFRKIERQISKYSGILDCFVFGVGADHSEVPMDIAAILVIDPNLQKSKLEKILIDCKNNLDPNDIPKIFKTMPEIPLDSTGRVDKLRIAEVLFQGKSIPKLYFEDYVF